jgi:hypothetical protein
MTGEEDLDAVYVITKSLEEHWVVVDQQIFIAAVIVNPFYQAGHLCSFSF